VAFAEGGWSAEAIAEQWHTGVGAEPETFGIPTPVGPGFSALAEGPAAGSGTANPVPGA